MKKLKYTAIAFLALSGTHSLFAYAFDNQFNISGGFRHDQISAHDLITFGAPFGGASWMKDKFSVNHIDMGQVGFDFRLLMPETDFFCEYPCISNLYLTGSADWAWNDGSHYKRSITNFAAGGAVVSTFSTHGKLKTTSADDFQVGLGYRLFEDELWAFNVIGGYSYNKQDFSTSHGFTSISGGAFAEDPLYEGLKFKQLWQGGWLGLEAFYDWFGWLFHFGYEYHYANYHLNINIPGISTTLAEDFSNTRNSHRGQGNVAYLITSYRFCNDVEVGVDFAFKDFRTRHGSIKPKGESFDDLGYPAGTSGNAKGKWSSYSIVGNVGYNF